MKRKPITTYKDKDSMGIHDVPLYSMITILDPSGITYNISGETKTFWPQPTTLLVLNKIGVLAETTISSFISNINNWSFLQQTPKYRLEGTTLYMTTDGSNP